MRNALSSTLRLLRYLGKGYGLVRLGLDFSSYPVADGDGLKGRLVRVALWRCDGSFEN